MAVIGAGPIGLEAALRAQQAGLDVVVFESGRVAESVRQWGHVRLFSPFGFNGSARGATAVGAAGLPDQDQLQTGAEFVESYLEPLAAVVAAGSTLHEQTRVVGVTRQATWKHHLVGQREQANDRFRLLVERGPGEEAVDEADVVLDCSGTWPHYRWIGAGGIPCPGERRLVPDDAYLLPDVLGTARPEYAGKHVLVVGSGYSAATSVVALARLAQTAPGTRVSWLTREAADEPLGRIADDTLSSRDQLAVTANELARTEGSPVDWLPGRRVLKISGAPGRLVVELAGQGGQGGQGAERLQVEQIVANVGYQPDRRLYQELQVHECYATGGPIRLAAALLAETGEDCLVTASGRLSDLQSPEPGFFVLGAKSYGRDSRFLIRTGIEQVERVIEHVEQEWGALA